jgi:DNA-binding beta-propeller fold protein YncE
MGRESTLLMQCATHGKELDFFCATCLVPVCVSCVVLNSGAHRFHEAVEMEQVRSETVADVTSLVDQARQRANELEAREVEFQNARQEMLTARVSGAEAIRHRFDVLIAHLQAKRDEMIVQHQVLVDSNVSIADDSIQALQTTHQYLHTIAAFTGRELEVERQRIRAEEDVLAGDLAVHDTPDGVTPAESTPGPSDFSTPAADVPNASPAAVAGIKKFFRSHLQSTLEQKVVNFSRTVMLNAIRGQLRQSLLEASDAQVSLWPVAVRATLAAEDPEAIPPLLTESLGLLDVARVDISMTHVSGSIFAAVSSDEVVNPMPRAVRVPVEGERIRLQLQLRDADRRAFKEGAWTWSPFVRATLSEQADGTAAPLELAPGYQQVDLHDGLYEVSFEARQGQWELLLLARDQWLPAIPFTCTAPIATALLSRIVGAGEAVLVDVDSTNQNAPLAMLNPSGVAYDAKNDLLIVTDQGQHRVVAIKRQNDQDQLVWQFGKTQLSGDGDSELNEPIGCAVHVATNTVAICDAGNDRCLLLRASDGKPLAMLGGSGSEEGQFCRPESCAFSDDGKHVWITDALNARVQCLNVNTGEMVRCIGGGAAAIFEHPNAVAVLGDRVFVSDAVKRHVLVFGNDLTTPLFTIGSAVSLSSLSHISVCSSRRYLYVTDADAARVHVFSAAAASSSTDPSQLYRYLGVVYPTLSELGTLRPISVCAGGNVVCVTDAVRHQVLMWSWSQ